MYFLHIAIYIQENTGHLDVKLSIRYRELKTKGRLLYEIIRIRP